MLAFPLLGCGSEQDEASTQKQAITVQRGNITTDITAAGNLSLSHTEELAFDLFYKEGTVEEVLVEESDSVEKGQVLARLDTAEWEDNLTVLQDTLTAAERQVTEKERALSTKKRTLTDKERILTEKQRALTSAERLVAAKEFALEQAQNSLQTEEYKLTQIEDVKKAQDEIDDAELSLKIIEEFVRGTLGSPGAWFIMLQEAQERLANAKQELQDVLADTGVRLTTDAVLEIATQKLQIEQAQRQIDDAKIAISNARIDVDDARIDIKDAELDIEDAEVAIEDAQTSIEDALQDVEDAREDLDEAEAKSSEIIATFDGFITRVNVEGGDEVQKGTVAVIVADPNRFEADILVSEIDIMQVKLGMEAEVQVDAMQGVTLPAKVTHIAPTATIQQGVVNYEVKVEVESLENVPDGQQNTAQGVPSEQETAVPQDDFQLREGLTVTVSIIVQQELDVLLVPYAAITSQGEQSYVQVLLPDGTIENRAIKTGITDYSSTQVIEGLSEGEAVIITQISTTGSATKSQQQPGGMMIPGMGGPPQGRPPPGG